ncbi:MAG: phytanoyl-CoA dioxygenase family protein [Lentisphaeria bacterium]|nr:phytanoyl-CoA dioxygenase family protein [Lentisphaeria bacterium]
MKNKVLTDEQVAYYREHGYLVLKNWIPADEIARIQEDMDRFIDPPEGHHKDMVIRDNMLSRITFPLYHAESFRHTYASPQILGLAHDIYDGNFSTFAESIVVKLPGDAGIDWHQDGNYTPDHTFDRGLNIGIYLQASRIEDGCLFAVPGSHLEGPADLDALNEGDFMIDDAIPVEVEAGDVILHSRSLIHGSDLNRSDRKRITYYMGFHDRLSVDKLFSPEEIEDRMQFISIAIKDRADSGFYPDEEPFESPILPAYHKLDDDAWEALFHGNALGF